MDVRKILAFAPRSNLDEASGAEAALKSLDGAIERKQAAILSAVAKVKAYQREEANCRAQQDEPTRIAEQIADEEQSIAATEVGGRVPITSQLKELRGQLRAALEQRDEAESAGNIARRKAEITTREVEALQGDLNALNQQRPERVRLCLLSRLAATSDAFEEARQKLIDAYVTVYGLALAHDKLSTAWRTGYYVAGSDYAHLRLPVPSGFDQSLDLTHFHEQVEAAALAVMRSLKVHA